MMGSLFCGGVKYTVQDPEPNEQLRKQPVPKIEQGTEQDPVQETQSEEPLGPELAKKWINITMKWEREIILKSFPEIYILLLLWCFQYHGLKNISSAIGVVLQRFCGAIIESS